MLSFLPALTCFKNSHYELCADTCSTTCASLTKSQKCPLCQEGCQCDDGFLFDGGECRTLDSCGCHVDGTFYKVRTYLVSYFLVFANSNQTVTFCPSHQNIILQSGQTVIRGECKEKCTCKAGVFSCETLECVKDQICGKKDGAVGCYNKGINNYNKCTIKAEYLHICQMFHSFFSFFSFFNP